MIETALEILIVQFAFCYIVYEIMICLDSDEC